MAQNLARILGTEEDKVNCPFYYKIGACRHGDRCSRTHLRPTFSQTLVVPHMYLPPPPLPDGTVPNDNEHFEEFYEEIAEEFQNFGEVEVINVVENLGDHMFGNVYVKYRDEEAAEKALKALTGRYYAGRVLMPEFSPVTDFREARCRQFEEATCARGGYCNFVHLKRIPRELRKLLRKKKKKRSRSRDRGRRSDGEKDRRKKSRSRSPSFDFKRASSAERRAHFASMHKPKKDDRRSRSRSPRRDERSAESGSAAGGVAPGGGNEGAGGGGVGDPGGAPPGASGVQG